MTSTVDAVIAALKVALGEAERSRASQWKTREANRWIGQLPGAWFGRWRNLKLKPIYDYRDDIDRIDFITQLRATLAYLEGNREQIGSATSLFSRGKLKRAAPKSSQPIDAEFQDVPHNVHSLPVPPPNKRNR